MLGCVEGRHGPACRVGAQRVGDQLETGDAVHYCVMQLHVEGEAAIVETVDQIKHAHWAGPVESLGVQLTDQPPELVSAGTTRQCPALDMLADVEVVSITPDPDAAGVQAAMGISAQPRVDRVRCGERLPIHFVDIPRACIVGGRQDQHSGHVHWVAHRLHGHHRRVQRIQPVQWNQTPISSGVSAITIALAGGSFIEFGEARAAPRSDVDRVEDVDRLDHRLRGARPHTKGKHSLEGFYGIQPFVSPPGGTGSSLRGHGGGPTPQPIVCNLPNSAASVLRVVRPGV